MKEEEIKKAIKTVTDMLLTASNITVAEANEINDNIDKKSDRVSITPRKCLENVKIILENDPRYAHVLFYNSADDKIYKINPLPWNDKDLCKNGPVEFDDMYDMDQLKREIQRDYNMSTKDIEDQVINSAMQIQINEVKEILEHAHECWDGKEHIRYLMPKYLGVDNDDYQYQALKLIMLTLIERQYHEGAKCDIILALNGDQGCGKSSFCRRLAWGLDKYFTDALGDLSDKDTLQIVSSKRVIELGEMLSIKRAKEKEAVKRFLSATQDTYRRPYGKTPKDYPRRCIIIATTNDVEYLDDLTGSRRFVPIECHKDKIDDLMAIQTEEAQEEFFQAWGEAYDEWLNLRAKTGTVDLVAMSYALAPEARKRAEMHQETDPYEGEIGVFLERLADIYKDSYDTYEQVHTASLPRVCAKQVAREALSMLEPSRFELKDITRILDNCFRKDWHRVNKRQRCGSYGLQTCWEYNGDNLSDLTQIVC